MTSKSAIFFWVTAIAILLLSITLSYHSSYFSSTIRDDAGVELSRKVASELDISVADIGTVDGTPDHHHILSACDESLWKSNLVSLYNVTLVLTVDSKGCGNFSSVQKAVDAVPALSSSWTLIIVNSGTYREKVVVSSNKTKLIVEGKGYLNTAVSWNDTAASAGGTENSATFGVSAPNFVAYNISFVNTAPAPEPGAQNAQAVAMKVAGDQSAFYGCGFHGAQDTLLANQGKHYYKECFIQGSIDFIWGNGKALFEDCAIHSTAKATVRGSVTGAITAHARNSPEENTGFSFVNCKIDGTGEIWLGRAYRPYSTVVFSKTDMSEVVTPLGWYNNGDDSRNRTVFFGEYANFGHGSNSTTNPRVNYTKALSPSAATQFISISFINGQEWLVNGPPKSIQISGDHETSLLQSY